MTSPFPSSTRRRRASVILPWRTCGAVTPKGGWDRGLALNGSGTSECVRPAARVFEMAPRAASRRSAGRRAPPPGRLLSPRGDACPLRAACRGLDAKPRQRAADTGHDHERIIPRSLEDGEDLGVRQVLQDLSDEAEVAGGQLVLRHVEADELHALRPVAVAVPADDLVHDVDPDVTDALRRDRPPDGKITAPEVDDRPNPVALHETPDRLGIGTRVFLGGPAAGAAPRPASRPRRSSGRPPERRPSA